ncbi:RICIN domain-containing protein [Streptomyces sp. NBC_01506]|uniref:RICIN domain-containing protein n=1 Tax=Streptomyces sp. NBC_01506 TaxID=2903887 RepID=UPI0038672B0F
MKKLLGAVLASAVTIGAWVFGAVPAQAAPASAPVGPAALAADVTVKNAYNGRCLQAMGAFSGAITRLVDCAATNTAQEWDVAWVYTEAGGYYELRNAASGLCLDADWGSIGGNGTRTQVWDCVAAQTNQHWRMKPITNRPDTYQVTVETNGRCLDGAMETISTNQGKTQLWNCLGSNQVNQHWQIT